MLPTVFQVNIRLLPVSIEETECHLNFKLKGESFYRNCGAASVGVLQDNLVLSTGLIM